jgi:hypothetical protein
MSAPRAIPPLVRDLYKRALLIGRDYPHADGMPYVRRVWKAALTRDRDEPAFADAVLRTKVAKGRFMLREMVGVIQLKKYRAMKRRYYDDRDEELQGKMRELHRRGEEGR